MSDFRAAKQENQRLKDLLSKREDQRYEAVNRIIEFNNRGFFQRVKDAFTNRKV